MVKLDDYRESNFVKVCNLALEDFVNDTTGVKNVMLATVDGFTIAHCNVSESGDQLAAVGSSIFALGATLASEFNFGACKSITIENEEGRVYILTIVQDDKQLILLVQSFPNSTLAMILHGAQKLSSHIKEALQKVGQK